MSETPRHRSFGKRKSVEANPLGFDLFEGKYEFLCKPALQGAIILDFVAASEQTDVSGAGNITDLINAALLNDTERERFASVIRSDDPTEVVEITDLTDIVAYLVEEYTSRPTSGSEQSSATS